MAGALIGVAEVAGVYSSGIASAADAAVIWLIALLIGLAIAIPPALSPRRPLLGQAEAPLLVLMPAALLGVRSCLALSQSNKAWASASFIAGIVAAAITLKLVIPQARRGADGTALLRATVVAWAAGGAAVALIIGSHTSPGLSKDAGRLGAAAAGYALFGLGVVAVLRGRSSASATPAPRTTLRILVLSAITTGGYAFFFGRSVPTITPIHGGDSLRPNVLVVVLDTVRRDHTSVYGYGRRTTPQLESLAERSLVFESAYSSSPYTLASHASLFTGLLPSQHGAHPRLDRSAGPNTDLPLRSPAATLAEWLGRAGYHTAAVVSNDGYFLPWSGLSRGFDFFDLRERRQYLYAPVLAPVLYRANRGLYDDLHYRFFGRTRPANEISDAAIRWLRLRRERPFFLFLNYFDAHAPYTPPTPYATAFLDQKDPWQETPVTRRNVLLLNPDERRFVIDQYDGAIAFADAELGRLLAVLESDQLLDNTLVVVTSDHGEFFGEHGLVYHAKTLQEEVLRIPLVVKLPGQRTGIRINDRVGLHHLPELIKKVVQGVRDAPVLIGDVETKAPQVLAEHWDLASLHGIIGQEAPNVALRAIYQDGWKLIDSSLGKRALWRLNEDGSVDLPDLSPQTNARVESMLRALPPLKVRDEGSPQVDVGTAARERLRSLGYVH